MGINEATATGRVRTGERLSPSDRGTLLLVGIAAAAAFVGGWFPAPDSPRVGQAGAAEIRSWAEANSAALHTTATALTVVAICLVLVGAGPSSLARRHLPASTLPEIVLGSAVVVAVLLVLDVAAATTPLLLPGLVDTRLVDVSDAVVVGWSAVGGFTHLLGDLQLAFVSAGLAAGSLIALRLGLMTRWLCYGGLVVAGCAALGSLAITLSVPALYPLWFVGTFGLYVALLVLAVAALLARRRLGQR
jgi:hypothetical protein